MNKKSKSLGLAMIIKNEAQNLEKSLLPLAGLFEEIIVVDTGSTDDSTLLAKKAGATVLNFTWQDNFSQARNFGLEKATTDYILWLDGDNSISSQDILALRKVMEGQKENSPFILEVLEKVIPQGDRLWQKRVFPNSKEVRFVGHIHEQLDHPKTWPVIKTNLEIKHWGYSQARLATQKGERNLKLLLKDPQTMAGDFYYLYQTGRTLLSNQARPLFDYP
jgi:glycosyltransferase involved in cell wall biosynthesis